MSSATFRDRRAARRPAPLEPVAVVPPLVFPAVLRATQVAHQTPLTDEWGAVYGWDLLVQCADISQHPGVFAQQIPVLARAFKTVDAGVTVHETDGTLVRVRVVTSWWLARQDAARQSRLKDRHPWPGPTLDPVTGRFHWSRLADGGIGYGRLWLPDDEDPALTQGARHHWHTGRSRAGKTGSMATALLSAVSPQERRPTAGVVYPCVIDMQGGVSLGEWRDRGVPYAENLDGANILARRLLLEGQARVAWMTDHAQNGFGRLLKAWPVPTPELPMILAVVDEAPALAEDAETMWIFAKIQREYAKAGIIVWWATQGHQAPQAFGNTGGGSSREQMKSGSVSQYSGSVQSRTEVFDVVDADGMEAVTELPRGIAGVNLHIGPDHETPVLGRAFYESNISAALDRHADIPDYELVDLPAEASPEVVADPTKAKDCAEAVRVLIGAAATGTVLETSAVNSALGSRWAERTIRDALGAAVTSGALVDAGKGNWRIT